MSRIKKKVTELEKVAEIIKNNEKPMNYQMLKQETGLEITTLQYCIPELEKRGIIQALPDWTDLRRNYYQWKD